MAPAYTGLEFGSVSMTRRTLMILAGVGASSPLARSQYVLPAQAPPSERFPPSPEQSAEIRRRMGDLEARLSALRQSNTPDENLVEVEIFHKAAAWIGRFNEY